MQSQSAVTSLDASFDLGFVWFCNALSTCSTFVSAQDFEEGKTDLGCGSSGQSCRTTSTRTTSDLCTSFLQRPHASP